jgi:hypothetical protein
MRRLGLVLVPFLALGACKRQPSKEQELARTQGEITQTLAEVQPSYQQLRTLRDHIDAPTPACTAPADPALLRITWNVLRVLTGDPVDAYGHAEGEPVASVPAPPIWDDRRLREMGSPTQARTAPLEKGLARQQLLDGHALVQAAPGFLVARTDRYVPPDPSKAKGTWAGGRVEGRAVVFDKAGTPKCHYRFEAETPHAPTDDPLSALGAELGRAIDAAVSMRPASPSGSAAPSASP